MNDKRSCENVHVEYAELSSHVRTALSVLWQAFNTYFVMNTLLATAGGFLFSRIDQNTSESLIGLILVSILGVFISGASIAIVWRFINYFDGLLARGKELEDSMAATTLTIVQRIGTSDVKTNAPRMTTGICIGFIVIWSVVIIYSVTKLIG
jgi:hypothetical protein